MTIRDTLFRYAPEFITVDVNALARIDLFIIDATADEGMPQTDRRWERAVALRSAALLTDADSFAVNAGGFARKREKTSMGEIEYQTDRAGGINSSYTNKYWQQHAKLTGLQGRSIPFAINGR